MQFRLDSSASFCTKKNTSSHILRNQNKLACTALPVAVGRLVTENKFRYLCAVLRSLCGCSHKTGKAQKTIRNVVCQCPGTKLYNKTEEEAGGLFLKVFH